MHSKKQAQVGVLLFNKVFIEILVEYSNYSNIFSIENAAKLPENTRINEHAIKLEEGKQPPFGSIYNLKSVKLKILKTYIKTNPVNIFIQPFKSFAGALIFFNKKPNKSFCFYMNY